MFFHRFVLVKRHVGGVGKPNRQFQDGALRIRAGPLISTNKFAMNFENLKDEFRQLVVDEIEMDIS